MQKSTVIQQLKDILVPLEPRM